MTHQQPLDEQIYLEPQGGDPSGADTTARGPMVPPVTIMRREGGDEGPQAWHTCSQPTLQGANDPRPHEPDGMPASDVDSPRPAARLLTHHCACPSAACPCPSVLPNRYMVGVYDLSYGCSSALALPPSRVFVFIVVSLLGRHSTVTLPDKG
jgi:hypothetical protein